jgi:hypothetical protein
MPLRDRWWVQHESIRTVGPFQGITAEALREALRRWHRAEPTSPALSRVDPAGRWIHLSGEEFAALCDDWVVELDAHGPHSAELVTRRLLDEPRGDGRLLLVIGGGFVGQRVSHAAGDGRTINRLLPGLLKAAVTGGTPPPQPATSPVPLTRAIARHFGRAPHRLAHAARLRRPPLTPPGTHALTGWKPALAYHAGRTGPGVLPRLRAWRDAHLPGVSMAAVSFALLNSAFTRMGIGSDRPGMMVLVDARRYLPLGMTVTGNFCWAEYVTPASLTDPRAVHQVMAADLSSGRTLVMLALRDARELLRGGAPQVPEMVRADPRPELTFTHTGRLTAYDDLPWAGLPADRRSISVPGPRGPESMIVGISELSDVLHVNAAYHRSTFDSAVVAQAVDLACSDPVGLLAQGGPADYRSLAESRSAGVRRP